ncbi:MAG: hypothetical protein R3330_18955, partial [Saprospiraceae bacterium]|nr:hypothetical protein [Saprospiraceae bacterium]
MNLVRIILFSGLTLWVTLIPAQASYFLEGETYFGKAGKDVFVSACQSQNGDLLFAGHTESKQNKGRDIWLTRTSPEGEIIWSRNYGGKFDEEAYKVRETIN